MNDDSNATKVLWFIAGASIGASIALLFAPAAGETTRAALAGKTGVLDRGRELFERARQVTQEAAEMFETGRKLIEDTAAHVQQG